MTTVDETQVLVSAIAELKERVAHAAPVSPKALAEPPRPALVYAPESPTGRALVSSAVPRLDLDGTEVHLMDLAEARATISAGAAHSGARPLAVASINLDHVHHFGRSRHVGRHHADAPGVEWLNLVDGRPIASQAQRLTKVDYPKLSGSDIVGPILDDAARDGFSIAFVGGSDDVTADLTERLARDWPTLNFAGHWSPSRAVLSSPEESRALAAELRAHGVDIVVVCLGKPRQEDWIAEYGADTGAGVLLAFGAVVDFLAGRVSRSPQWIAEAGFEWAWRLMQEPRRLARRYLIQGFPSYLALRRARVVA